MEQDPKEILNSVYECIEKTCEKLGQLNIDISNIKGIFNILLYMALEGKKRKNEGEREKGRERWKDKTNLSLYFPFNVCPKVINNKDLCLSKSKRALSKKFFKF